MRYLHSHYYLGPRLSNRQCTLFLSIIFTGLLSLPLSFAAEKPVLVVSQNPQQNQKFGQFRARFSIPSPLSRYINMAIRMSDETEAAQLQQALSSGKFENIPQYSFDINQETYEIYVPDHYSRHHPIGLLVYIPAQETGIPAKQYLKALDNQYMIYIAANNSGNSQNTLQRRFPLALDAVDNMTKAYNIDPDRIYISGISGGAKVASYLGVGYGDIFTGALHIIGSFPLSQNEVKPPKGALSELVKHRNRYVFLTGGQDFNRKEVRSHYRSYKKFGIQHTRLIDVSNMGHETPATRHFKRAINALDKPLIEAAEANYHKAKKAELAGEQKTALGLYQQAVRYGFDQKWLTDTCSYIRNHAAIDSEQPSPKHPVCN